MFNYSSYLSPLVNLLPLEKIQKIFWFSPRLFVTLQLKRKRLCEDQK